MKTMARNKTAITYSLYTGMEYVRDSNGYLTGERKPSYATPKSMKALITSWKGGSDIDQAGIGLEYEMKMLTDWLGCPIDEHSKVFVGTKEYNVTKVARSLNHINYVLTEVKQ